MKHSIIFKYLNFKKILLSKRSIARLLLGLLAVLIVSSPIGCGPNKNSHFNRYGYGTYGRYPFGHGGGYVLDTASGHNMLGHEIHLEFLSWNQQYASHRGGPYMSNRNGPIDIQGEVIFSDSINSSVRFLHAGYSDYGYDRYGYGYDPCYIQPNEYFRVSLDPQYGPATMQGNDFGDYELLAYGPYGEIVSILPVNPQVGASFLLGHNNPNGQVSVFMDMIVQRIDSGYCPERQVTFGAH